MTHAQLATILLGNFSPEERSVPDSLAYPGRNAAVMAAINGALQEAYNRSPVWVNHAEFGVILHEPTAVTVSVTADSKVASIAGSEAWMEGCEIVIAGHDIDNRIMTLGGSRAAASVTINPAGADNSITYTAVEAGLEGNGISIKYVISGTGSAVLSVVASGLGITVTAGSATTAASVITAVNANPAAAALVTAAASGVVTGLIVETSATNLSGGLDGTTLLYPYGGDSGTVDATVYHTSIPIPSNVMRVLKPVLANHVELIPVANPASHQAATFGDFASNPRQNLVPRNVRVAETKGKVTGYKLENHHVSATSTPTQRMRIVPAPAEDGFLSYRATILPQFVTSLAAASEFPIPHQFVESIIMPMALYRLSRAPFFRNEESLQGIASGYQQALADLDALTPQEDNERRMRPIYG